MSRDTGGSAFPNKLSSGQSLRDYFAGQALVGMCANPRTADRYEGTPYPLAEKRIAKAAYSFADKMLAAREKNNGND